MASPSSKQLLTASEGAGAPVSPRVDALETAVDAPVAPTSPRLRGLLTTSLETPVPSPRARALTTGALEAYAPVSPRVRSQRSGVQVEPVRVWPAQPNWDSGVTERLGWLTDVIVSHDGTEQRIGMRTRPVRAFDYPFLLTPDQLPHVEAILHAWQDQTLLIPIWTDVQVLTEELAAGSQVIPCDYSTRDFEIGGRAAIFAPDYNAADYGARDSWYEVVEVSDLGTTGLVVNLGTVRAWPRGSWLMPVREGLLSESATWTRQTAEGGTGNASIRLTDPGYPSLVGLVIPDQYRGLDVLPWRADRDTDLDETYQRLQSRFASSGGTVQVTQRTDRPDVVRGPAFTFPSREEILELRAWLALREGRRRAYYASSGNRDLDLVFPAAAADRSLLVKGVRGAQLYGRRHGPSTLDPWQNLGREDIEIRERAGSAPIRRRILEWAEAGEGVDQLFLDASPGEALVPGREVLSLLGKVRLESDTLDLRWLTDGLVTVTLPTRSI